jgi:hypothetical protein
MVPVGHARLRLNSVPNRPRGLSLRRVAYLEDCRLARVESRREDPIWSRGMCLVRRSRRPGVPDVEDRNARLQTGQLLW